jgi:hypothetical protein
MFMGAEIAGRPNQDDFLTGATAGLAQAGLQVTLTDQDPGSYGGKMQCGTAASPQGIPLGLCVWIDDDTFGVIIGFNDNAAKITTLAPAMRADIEN